VIKGRDLVQVQPLGQCHHTGVHRLQAQ
jgi:hypothetical protein